MMNGRACPRCGHPKSLVKNVRDMKRPGLTMRSRLCPKCGRKWQTVEIERWYYNSLLPKEEESMMKEAKSGKWMYYTNEDGKARWKCSKCGKICRRDPHDKKYCSNCGSKNVKEA